MFPVEIDLDQVRRQRETGFMGLGQVLKSFRDRAVDFPVYNRTSGVDGYLHTLGKLETPGQGSKAGLPSSPASLLPSTEATAPLGTGLPPAAGKTVTG